MKIKAIILNCTLKPSPEESNTEALINKAVRLFNEQMVECQVIRAIDHNIAFGTTSDEGDDDEWPAILAEIKKSHILILASPVWLGDKSSICKLVIERIDASTDLEDPETGQYPLYNKVGAALVTGNEDGGKKVCSEILFSLNHSGCSLPPAPMAYWVGDAGPGPSYIEGGGDNHLFTNKNLRYMVHNTAYMAKLLNDNPIPTNLHELSEAAEKESE